MLLSSLQQLSENTVSPIQRLQSAKLLHIFAHMPGLEAFELERHIMLSSCDCTQTYQSQLRRQTFNISCNPVLTCTSPDKLIHMTNEEFACGTMIERVQTEEQERMKRYVELLKEKYENVANAQTDSLLKCRNCGSSDITFSQKQTRGADESSTVFCSCQVCSKRWRLS